MRCWIAVAGAVLSAAAVAPLAACASSPPDRNTATLDAPHPATLVGNERPSATLNMLTGTAALKIGTANFGAGSALLRVSTPRGAPPPDLRETTDGAQPQQDTMVDLSAPGASAVTVTLNAAVRWRLVLGGGTTRTAVDLRGAQVSGVAFTAGSDVISLTLPRPGGRVPVRLAGGASQFLLSLPGGVLARVTAAGGAGEVSLAGQDHVGVGGGSVFTTPGWAPDAASYDIDATAGAARLVVTARK